MDTGYGLICTAKFNEKKSHEQRESTILQQYCFCFFIVKNFVLAFFMLFCYNWLTFSHQIHEFSALANLMKGICK